MAASISLASSSAEPSTGFNCFFNCSALRPWTFRSCSRSLIVSGSWLSSCLVWDRASSTCLSYANRDSLFADRSEILCFRASPEDFRVPMVLCFSSVRSFFLHHLFGKTSLSSSDGKALGHPLVLQLTALQVCCLKENFFDIGGDVASQSLE